MKELVQRSPVTAGCLFRVYKRAASTAQSINPTANPQIPSYEHASDRPKLEQPRPNPTGSQASAFDREVVHTAISSVSIITRPSTSGLSSKESPEHADGERSVPSAPAPMNHQDAALSPALSNALLVAFLVMLAAGLIGLAAVVCVRLRTRFFSPRAILARAAIRGLRRKQFYLEYQPIFYTQRRKCIGIEVMLRWRKSAYGLRGVAWCIGELDSSAVVAKMLRFIVTTAAAELEGIVECRTLYVLVTVPASYLKNDKSAAEMSTMAKAFSSSRLVLQIAADELPNALDEIANLRDEKVRVAVSDVRASELEVATLTPLRLEFIKLHRDVMALPEDDRIQVLQDIAEKARELDVAVIADGVEGLSQYHALGRSRIELAQGFFLGKALTAARLPAFIKRVNGWQQNAMSRRPQVDALAIW